MRIGIDARELCGHPTGAGRYLSGLLAQWAVDEPAQRHEFILYAHQPPATALDARRFTTRLVGGTGGTRWEQQHLPAAMSRDLLDAFFAPAYTAPLFTRQPIVVAIHDVSFAAHPEWFTAREGLRRRLMTRRSAAVARAVTTLSEFSKRELIERLSVPASKIHVIRPGVTSPASGSPPPLSTSPRVLYVGSIFNRRHVPDVIRAFGRLARTHADICLDLVGDNRTHPHEDILAAMARQRVDHRITWHRFLPDDELRALYASARAFVFLSEYEGLGLTPLEALSVGIPSVLLDTPIARESCGPAALYAREGDIAAVASMIEALLFDQPTRQRVLTAAPGVLARYDWMRAARETLAVIESAQ